VASEKENLAAQMAQQARAVEEAYAAKAAELERIRASEEEKFRSWRIAAEADFAQKSRLLDTQWAAQERDLMLRHENALEAQRRAFHAENEKTREQFEKRLREIETDALRRDEVLRESRERRERELQESWLAQDRETRRRHEEALAQARADYERCLKVETERMDGEIERIRLELQQQLESRERVVADKTVQVEKTKEEARARLTTFQARVEQAEKAYADLWEELRGRERSWEAQRQAIHDEAQKEVAVREQRYLEMERRLHAVWTKKTAEQANVSQADLEIQQGQFLEELARRDAAHRQALKILKGRLEDEFRQKLAALERNRQGSSGL